MKNMEAFVPSPIQTRKEETPAAEWTAAKVPIEDRGFIRTCRFIEVCDGLLKADGCPTCDFVRGVILEYVE
jgi:hypothetical protein